MLKQMVNNLNLSKSDLFVLFHFRVTTMYCVTDRIESEFVCYEQEAVAKKAAKHKEANNPSTGKPRSMQIAYLSTCLRGSPIKRASRATLLRWTGGLVFSQPEPVSPTP